MTFADNRFLHIVTVFKLFSHNWTVSILFSKKGGCITTKNTWVTEHPEWKKLSSCC